MFSPNKNKYIDAQSLEKALESPNKPRRVKSVFESFSDPQLEDLGISLRTQLSPIQTPKTQKELDKSRKNIQNVSHEMSSDETQVSLKKTLDKIDKLFEGTLEKKNDSSSDDQENEISKLGETFAMIERLRQTRLNKSNDVSSLVVQTQVETPVNPRLQLQTQIRVVEESPEDKMDQVKENPMDYEPQVDVGGYDDGPCPGSPELGSSSLNSYQQSEPEEREHSKTRIKHKDVLIEFGDEPKKIFVTSRGAKSESRPRTVSKKPKIKRVLSFDEIPDMNPMKKEKKSVKDLEQTIKFQDTLNEDTSVVPLLETHDRYIDPRIKVVNLSDFDSDFLQSVGQKLVNRETAEIIKVKERNRFSRDVKEDKDDDDDSEGVQRTKSGRKVKPPGEYWK